MAPVRLGGVRAWGARPMARSAADAPELATGLGAQVAVSEVSQAVAAAGAYPAGSAAEGTAAGASLAESAAAGRPFVSEAPAASPAG